MSQKQCYKCGKTFGPKNLQACPLRDKKCTKRGHFAKECRSESVIFFSKTIMTTNPVLLMPQNKEEKDPVASVGLTNEWDELQKQKFSMSAIAEAFKIKPVSKVIDGDRSGHMVKLKTKTDNIFAIADSNSPTLILNKTTACHLRQNDKSTILKNIPMEDAAQN